MWHHCLRVYLNGDQKLEPRNAKELPGWLEYNQVMRFGCALFVDGVCKYNGYLNDEECRKVEEGIKSKPSEFDQDYLQRNMRNGRA